MSAAKSLITAEQLPEVANGRRVELVRGELVEMTRVGGKHTHLVGLLLSWIVPYVREHQLGMAGPEGGFVLERNPDVVRAPDIAFTSRLREESIPEGFIEGAPDLAIEVLSPSDKAVEVQAKVRDYLTHGVRLVWVVDSRSRTVTAYHPSGDAHLYSDSDQVPGEDVLPGFSFRPTELFG